MVHSASQGFFHHFKWSKRATGSRTPRIGGSSLLAMQLLTSSLATIPTMDTAALTRSVALSFARTSRALSNDYFLYHRETVSWTRWDYSAQCPEELEASAP